MTDIFPTPFVAFLTFGALILAEIILLPLLRLFGFYTIVHEREAKVYVLFGDIVGVISDPGIHFLWFELGWRAFFVCWLGQLYERNTSIEQNYLRSIPVNSEEGTPMGIGVWYEMFVTDAAAHVFKNVDPEGSLSANVRNATMKRLSNLPLTEMLSNRHTMSRIVSSAITPDSAEWGYGLGSIYIRKVHFRDIQMIKQIEEKVVNRLRMVTSAIRQDGLNQVNVIASKAEQEASIEFARAAMVRPQIVGDVLREIGKDAEVLAAMFQILETERILDSNGELTILPSESGSLLPQLLAAEGLNTQSSNFRSERKGGQGL
jgi:regulator of protease activity HflC (stomatin/prohibitin superfamily)